MNTVLLIAFLAPFATKVLYNMTSFLELYFQERRRRSGRSSKSNYELKSVSVMPGLELLLLCLGVVAIAATVPESERLSVVEITWIGLVVAVLSYIPFLFLVAFDRADRKRE